MRRYSIILTLVVIVLGVVIWQQVRDARQLGSELNNLNIQIDSLRIERNTLYEKYGELILESAELEQKNVQINDSLQRLLSLIGIISAENDSLREAVKTVPYDEIYSRMQAIAVNVQNLPLIYPFSGPQIRFYYAAFIDNNGNKKMLKTQENALNTCLDYSEGLKEEVKIYALREDNLEDQLKLADASAELFKESTENLTKQLSNVKKKGKLYTILTGVGAFLFGLAIK